jgi:hypothetical protein
MNNNIIERLERIEAKLDEVIAAMHAYDDANIEDINEGYGESSFEAFQDTKNDILIWDVDGAERRMDIIGQNGNEGLHYTDVDENEFNDYGERKAVGKDNNNNSDKRTGEPKKRNKRKYYKPKQQ